MRRAYLFRQLFLQAHRPFVVETARANGQSPSGPTQRLTRSLAFASAHIELDEEKVEIYRVR